MHNNGDSVYYGRPMADYIAHMLGVRSSAADSTWEFLSGKPAARIGRIAGLFYVFAM